MLTPPKSSLFAPRYKSVAAALIFSVLLGPVGLLYASFWGGLTMIIIGMIVFSAGFLFPIILLWLISALWAVRAVESYNHRLFQRMLMTSSH